MLCHHALPTLHQWHQAVLKPTRSSLINITPVPLRTAAPSILRCTPALRDVTARLLAVSAHRVSSSVFSFYSRDFSALHTQWIYLAHFFISVPPQSLVFLQTPRGLSEQEPPASFPHFLLAPLFCPALEFCLRLPQLE